MLQFNSNIHFKNNAEPYLNSNFITTTRPTMFGAENITRGKLTRKGFGKSNTLYAAKYGSFLHLSILTSGELIGTNTIIRQIKTTPA